MPDVGKLSGDFLSRVAATTDPQGLSERIYDYCAPLAEIRKIDLICNETNHIRRIACFIETPTLREAHRLAQHLGVTVFGEQGLVFELPFPDGFRCAPYSHPGNGARPARVVFNCLVR